MYLTKLLSTSQNKILFSLACIWKHTEAFDTTVPFCEACSCAGDLFLLFSACRKWGRVGFHSLPLFGRGKLVQVHCAFNLIVTQNGKQRTKPEVMPAQICCSCFSAQLSKAVSVTMGNYKRPLQHHEKMFFAGALVGAFCSFSFGFWIVQKKEWGQGFQMAFHNTDFSPLFLLLFCGKCSMREMYQHLRLN